MYQKFSYFIQLLERQAKSMRTSVACARIKFASYGIWPCRHQLRQKSEYLTQIYALFFKGFKLRNELRDLKVLVTVEPDM